MPDDQHAHGLASAAAESSDPCPRCGIAIPAADSACVGCGFAVTPRRDDPAARARRFRLPPMAVGAIVVSTIEMAVLLWLLFGRRG